MGKLDARLAKLEERVQGHGCGVCRSWWRVVYESEGGGPEPLPDVHHNERQPPERCRSCGTETKVLRVIYGRWRAE